MEKKIADLLYENFRSVYCDDCRFYNDENDGGYDPCESCIRKSMNWALSRDSADELAEEIMKLVK